MCGLRKVGPNSYKVVAGTVVGDKAIDWKVDHVDQSLEFSAEALKTALKRLLAEIP